MEDHIDIDHIVAKAANGHDGLENKQALHNHCHDQKTAQEDPGRARTAVSDALEE